MRGKSLLLPRYLRLSEALKTMEKLQKIYDYLKSKPLWVRLVAIAIITAVAVVFLCSCGTTQKLPDLSEYKVGAEGVVSKEKTTTKQTKWYFKPDSLEES